MREKPDKIICVPGDLPERPPYGAMRSVCALCGRPLIPGPSIDQHHLIPRSHGGKFTVTLHLVCHRAIHAFLTEGELAATFSTPAALRRHPDLAKFIAWVRKRPADYVDRHRWSRQRQRK